MKHFSLEAIILLRTAHDRSASVSQAVSICITARVPSLPLGIAARGPAIPDRGQAAHHPAVQGVTREPLSSQVFKCWFSPVCLFLPLLSRDDVQYLNDSVRLLHYYSKETVSFSFLRLPMTSRIHLLVHRSATEEK